MIDLFVDLPDLWPMVFDTIEAREPPPLDLPLDYKAACWIMTLAPVWTSTVFIFSPKLYQELAAIPLERLARARGLFGFAVEIRENHPDEYLRIDPIRRPNLEQLKAWGLKEADAEHVADAIGAGATHFLSCDKRLVHKASQPAKQLGLQVMRPMDFILQAFHAGAPFPSGVNAIDFQGRS
jgi:hypothetical protein